MEMECKLGRFQCADNQQMEGLLRACAGDGMDDIWVYAHEARQYPSLSVLVNGALACVHYFSGSSMYQSRGDMDAQGTVAFCPGGEVSELPAYTAIPLDRAIACVAEFSLCGGRPSCIEWNAL